MGKRGPKPTPSAILKLRGTARKSRTRNEPKPGPGVPRCPAWLDEQAKHAWRQIVPELVAMRVLAVVDRNALSRYCVLWSRWKAAEQFLQVAIAHRLAMALSRMESEFGMTPSGRARIQAMPQPPVLSAEEQEFDRFLAGAWTGPAVGEA